MRFSTAFAVLAAVAVGTNAIQVGDKIPDVTIHSGFPPSDVNVPSRIAGKQVVIVGLPGAFTPT